jgi:hypothetical protein
LAQKIALFRELRCVDEVVVGDDEPLGLNFRSELLRIRPDILAAGEDDRYVTAKQQLCEEVGARYVQIPKSRTWPDFSTTQLVERMRTPLAVPLRVDLAGGWLDVPKLARPGAYIVNCAITPGVSLHEWPYERCSGLGGSAASRLLSRQDPVQGEILSGVGWQDPAVMIETGLCVWHSGTGPSLQMKVDPQPLLGGRMALWWSGQPHNTTRLVDLPRDYARIELAGHQAATATAEGDFGRLCQAVQESYTAQLDEGMHPLECWDEAAKKYCGSGWGGYALYLFIDRSQRDRFVADCADASPIEPFLAAPMDRLQLRRGVP